MQDNYQRTEEIAKVFRSKATVWRRGFDRNVSLRSIPLNDVPRLPLLWTEATGSTIARSSAVKLESLPFFQMRRFRVDLTNQLITKPRRALDFVLGIFAIFRLTEKTCVRHEFTWLFTANLQDNETVNSSSQVADGTSARTEHKWQVRLSIHVAYGTLRVKPKRGQLFWPVCTPFLRIPTFSVHPTLTKWVELYTIVACQIKSINNLSIIVTQTLK